MKDKYYTPKIEEFCVGFEYEEEEPYTGEWSKLTVDIKTSLEWLNDRSGEFRVKYLDKEDIEDCGFSHEGGKLIKDIIEHYTKEEYTLTHYCKSNKVDLSWKSYRRDGSGEFKWKTAFEGTIKNKSELKKIMQMLNIK